VNSLILSDSFPDIILEIPPTSSQMISRTYTPQYYLENSHNIIPYSYRSIKMKSWIMLDPPKYLEDFAAKIINH